MGKQPSTGNPYDNGRAVVDERELVWPDSHCDDKPGFLIRGYYRDATFTCRDCGVVEVWTARQQKWWYEVAKGGIFTKASRCRACRKKERDRVSEARRIHLQGLAAKNPKSGTVSEK